MNRPDAKNRSTSDVQVETDEANSARGLNLPHEGGQSIYQAEPKTPTALETSSKHAGNHDGRRGHDIAPSMGTGMEDPQDSIEDMEEDKMAQDRISKTLNARDAEIGNNADGQKRDHNTRKHDDGRANIDSDDQPRLEGTSLDLTPVSPKAKDGREAAAPRERTRSKTRLKTPQVL